MLDGRCLARSSKRFSVSARRLARGADRGDLDPLVRDHALELADRRPRPGAREQADVHRRLGAARQHVGAEAALGDRRHVDRAQHAVEELAEAPARERAHRPAAGLRRLRGEEGAQLARRAAAEPVGPGAQVAPRDGAGARGRRLVALDAVQRARQVGECGVAQRARRVGRVAARLQRDRQRVLVDRRHAHQARGAGAVLEDPAALVERDAGVDLRPRRLGEPARAVVAALLVGLGEQDDVALERHLGARDPRRGHGERGEAALEVHRAAAVDEAASDQARERVHRPEVALDAHDVLVAGQQERLLGRVLGAQAREEVGLARRRRRHDLDLEPERREPRLQQLGDLRLVARRVGGVDPDQLLQQRDDLAVGPVVLRLRHARQERASDQERHQYTRQPPRTHAPRLPTWSSLAGDYPPRWGRNGRASSVRVGSSVVDRVPT